jgi:hypothetical protein
MTNNKKQQQKPMRGFFASLRMTTLVAWRRVAYGVVILAAGGLWCGDPGGGWPMVWRSWRRVAYGVVILTAGGLWCGD